jgi:16S rRNA (cytosine1402-N4)-methyltransferase
MHTPVMLRECLEYLGVRPDGIYLDCTSGLAGHSAAIARMLTTGFVLSCDRDAESLALAKENTLELADRIRFRQATFSGLGEMLAEVLRPQGLTQVNGLLADLGVSKYQLTSSERGFSLMSDGPLDMRQDRGQERSASDIVNYES